MARDNSPIVKQSRREGYALHPKAHKILAKKSGIPGQHAHGRQNKPSLYVFLYIVLYLSLFAIFVLIFFAHFLTLLQAVFSAERFQALPRQNLPQRQPETAADYQ